MAKPYDAEWITDADERKAETVTPFEPTEVYEAYARSYGWYCKAADEHHHGGITHPQGYWAATWKDACLRFQYIDGKIHHDLF